MGAAGEIAEGMAVENGDAGIFARFQRADPVFRPQQLGREEGGQFAAAL